MLPVKILLEARYITVHFVLHQTAVEMDYVRHVTFKVLIFYYLQHVNMSREKKTNKIKMARKSKPSTSIVSNLFKAALCLYCFV
jgi:hypothetical protein